MIVQFTMSLTNLPQNVREYKGKSLLLFPDNYCVIDIETTGLSSSYDHIIEISALKISSDKIIDTFSTLVQPPGLEGYYVSEFITELTGITNDMLSSAPTEEEVIPKFKNFIGDFILVAHNAHFDINFLYDSFMHHLALPLKNDFVDTMRISRKLHKNSAHHRLSDVAEICGIDYSDSHRAQNDCRIAYECFLKMKSEVLLNNIVLDASPKKHSTGLKAKDIFSTNDEIDESNPLYGKVVVFTGTLEKMVRREAMQLVANLGGINADGVTKKTNYLVLGNNDYCKSIKDGKSSKQKKAESLKLQGGDIEIIPESVFYEIISDQCFQEISDINSDFRNTLSVLLQDIIKEWELPPKGLDIKNNLGKKKDTSSVCICEPPFPATKGDLEKTSSAQSILKFEEKEDMIVLTVKIDAFNAIQCPEDVQSKPASGTPKNAPLFMEVFFPLNHPDLYTYIKNIITYRLKHYTSSADSFACCSQFIKCSDEKKCVHENRLYSTACIYRRNLESGRIFYGKNRNID